MSANNFKLVPKFPEPNLLVVWLVLPTGDSRAIAYVNFPNDSQILDNVETANSICALLKKRIKKSVN